MHCFVMMEKTVLAISALVLLIACTPENKHENGGSGNDPDKLVVTGGVLEVAASSITFFGYANLPFDCVDAVVGVLYDKTPSFESAVNGVATGFDGKNKYTVTATGLSPATTYYYKFYVKNGPDIRYGAVKTVTTDVIRVERIDLDKSYLPLLIGDVATVAVTDVLPKDAHDKSYTWSTSDADVASVDNSGQVTAKARGSATVKATANDGSGVSASCVVDVCWVDVPQAVDMGIVVDGKKIKWATFNVGASAPEEYGFYYAWGETEPKSDYAWATYKWGTGIETLTKYNSKSSFGNVDRKSVLDPEDDVARVKLGGKWRMPTDAEWTELISKCTWTWTDNYKRTGVKGSIVTAGNGNSIFLPASGGRFSTSPSYEGSYGFAWSSSVHTGNPYHGWSLFCSPERESRFNLFRNLGLPVRPVTE